MSAINKIMQTISNILTHYCQYRILTQKKDEAGAGIEPASKALQALA